MVCCTDGIGVTHIDFGTVPFSMGDNEHLIVSMIKECYKPKWHFMKMFSYRHAGRWHGLHSIHHSTNTLGLGCMPIFNNVAVYGRI